MGMRKQLVSSTERSLAVSLLTPPQFHTHAFCSGTDHKLVTIKSWVVNNSLTVVISSRLPLLVADTIVISTIGISAYKSRYAFRNMAIGTPSFIGLILRDGKW